MILRRMRDEACPSALAFDRWLADELGPAKVEELERHLATCARCQSSIREVRLARAAFSGEPPPWLAQPLVSPPAPADGRSRRGAIAAVVGGVGLAAVIVLWARGPAESRLDVGSATTRSKGTARVSLFVQHAGAVRLASDGEHVLPGDAIEFAYSTDRSEYLAVVSVDGADHASAYYAREGRAVRVEAARGVPVDQSTVLDATLGEEVLYALFCDHPIEVGPVVSALDAAPRRAPSPAGCVVDRHTLVKAVR